MILGAALLAGGSPAQPALLPLLSNWDDNSIPPAFYGPYNEIWGYADQAGREYAIIGSSEGTYFIDVTVPTAPVIVDFERSRDTVTLAIHRDYKTYQNYCYAVADEGDNSLQIFDLQYLPDSVSLVYDDDQYCTRAHNIFIADDKLFLASNSLGFNFNAMDVLSLANPVNPTYLSTLSGNFSHVHDVFVRNDTAFCSNGSAGLFIYSFVNPTNPVLLASLTNYPQQGYNHSSWSTPDGRTLVFADETHGKAMKVMDISDLSNLSIYSYFQSNLLNIPNPGSSTGSIPHNPFIIGNTVYVSYYHDGVQVYDISDPLNPVNIAYYDTYTQHNNYSSYQGCWGVYPYLPSGIILASDFENGLFVLDGSSLLGVHEPAAGEGSFAWYQPGEQAFHISLTLAASQKVNLEVYDMQGRLVAEKQERAAAGSSTTSLTAGNLSGGIYVVRVNGERVRFSHKVAVQE